MLHTMLDSKISKKLEGRVFEGMRRGCHVAPMCVNISAHGVRLVGRHGGEQAGPVLNFIVCLAPLFSHQSRDGDQLTLGLGSVEFACVNDTNMCGSEDQHA